VQSPIKLNAHITCRERSSVVSFPSSSSCPGCGGSGAYPFLTLGAIFRSLSVRRREGGREGGRENEGDEGR